MPKNPNFKKTILSTDHPAVSIMDQYEKELAALKEEDKAFHRELHARHEALTQKARMEMHAAMGTTPADGEWGIDTDHRDIGVLVAIPREEEEEQNPLARLLGGLVRHRGEDDEDAPQAPNCGHLH